MEQPYPQEQEQYQSVPVSPNELYANAMQEDKVKNIIAQLDPDNQLREIEMRIKGYKKNMLTQDWEKIDEDAPEPPKLLVSKFISYLGSFMNQNLTQSNLSEDQVNKIMKLVIEYISDELDSNEELYNLKDNYTEKTRIGDIIIVSTFAVLSRALNGQEAKRMWKALSLTESYSSAPPKNKMIEALKFWK
jgi:hypothetical protein